MDITFNPGPNPYEPGREPVLARKGMVAASEPHAVQAGLEMLRRGGNAVDAALATAIALTVVEPTSNGIGSDAFALVWDGRKLHGLNGSGRAPGALTMDRLRERGHVRMPVTGWEPVTVPGAPAAWGDLHARFGKLPFADLFAPAIRYAEDGFPVSPIVAVDWSHGVQYHSQLSGPEFAGWMPAFAPGGWLPGIRRVFKSPSHAATLRRIAQAGARDFYAGETAEKILAFAKATGGYFTEQDLAGHSSAWVEPITTSYRGYDVWEMPPNGQGITALIGLNILEGFDMDAYPRDSVRSFHRQIEALKLAFGDTLSHVADPDFVQVPVQGLLDKAYAARRRALIVDEVPVHDHGHPDSGGTVYLCTADADGMMVSYIQSNYLGFGSGVVIPETGIALHNRGYSFNLDPRHPNHLEPGKRPYHTIIPGFLTHRGEAVGPFGVMGAFMQPQGHVQMMVNTIDYRMDPQASLDAPRWQWTGDNRVMIESDADEEIAEVLREMGHEVSLASPGGAFGRGQIIWRMPSGDLLAGSDKRADGYAGAL